MGGYRDSDGRYHGRTARWVYGQGTAYHTMTARFPVVSQPVGTATLTLVGIDSEDEPKTPVRISVNGEVVFQGGNPLPNDFCCGSSGPGNWGSVRIRIPAGVLQQGTDNTLTISNLDPSDRIFYPIFVMIDRATVTYRGR